MGILKRFAALFLTAVLCFSYTAYAGGTVSPSPSPEPAESRDIDDLYFEAVVEDLRANIRELEEQIRQQEENPSGTAPQRPVVMVVDPLLVEIEAGKTQTIELTIKNLATDSAKNIVTTASAPSGGLAASFEGNDGYVYSLGNKESRKVKLKITADRTATDGYRTIDFSHSFLNSLNVSATTASAIGIRVTNPSLSNTVVLKDISAPSNIAPGADFNLSAVVTNESASNVSDISVAVEGVQSDQIYIKNATNVVSFNSMAPNGVQTVTIPLSVNAKIKKGSYPLTLKLSYYDADSETKQQSKTYTYYVNVSGESESTDASEIVVTQITAPTGDMGVGQEFTMTVTIQNKSAFEAGNVKISAKPDGEAGAVVPKSTSIAQFSSMAAGDVREAAFTFAATAASKSQNYVIGFTVDYENGREDAEGVKEVVSYTQYQGVNVVNPDADEEEDEEEKRSVPKIIIKEYASEPIIVRAGAEYDLSMVFLNTSSETAVKNVKVILTVEEGTEKKGSVFTPVNSSNTFYIDRIEAKGEVMQKIRMYTVPDASPKNYIINVKFEYEDMENNPHESLESVGINVKQVTKLDTSEIIVDEFASLWQPVYVSFEMYNTGKVTLSNLMIRVEGNFETDRKSQYYGSFTPSSTDYYENQVMPTEEGPQELALIISYEDDTGEKIEERREFTMEVSPEPEMTDPMSGMPPEGMEGMVFDEETGMWVEEKKGLSLPVMAVIGAAAAAAVITTVIIVKRRKKKKEEADIDE